MPFRICPRRSGNKIEICECGVVEMQLCLAEAISEYLEILRGTVGPDPCPFSWFAADIANDAVGDAFTTYRTFEDVLRELEE